MGVAGIHLGCAFHQCKYICIIFNMEMNKVAATYHYFGKAAATLYNSVYCPHGAYLAANTRMMSRIWSHPLLGWQ